MFKLSEQTHDYILNTKRGVGFKFDPGVSKNVAKETIKGWYLYHDVVVTCVTTEETTHWYVSSKSGVMYRFPMEDFEGPVTGEETKPIPETSEDVDFWDSIKDIWKWFTTKFV